MIRKWFTMLYYNEDNYEAVRRRKMYAMNVSYCDTLIKHIKTNDTITI